MLTREYLPGLGWAMQDATFRAYADPSASSSDWWRLMQTPRYSNVYGASDLDSAYGALGKSGYATDPEYVSKLRGLVPATPEQQAFLAARQQELQKAGAPEHLAELGARQSALETGWGRSAPNNNFYGIKAPQQVAQAGRQDIQQGLFAEAKPMAGQQAPQPMAPQQQMMPPMGMQPPGFWDKLAGSPAFNMGLGILASNTGNYGAAGPAIGRGALLGMQNAGSLQEGRAEQMYKQMQMQQAQMKYQKDLQDAAKVDAWVATLPPDEQQLAGIIGADKLAQFKLEQQKGPTPTDDMREYQKAVEQGFSGTLMDYQTKMKQAGASNVNVSVGGDKKYVEKRGELDATEMARLQSSASGAYRNNFALERVLTSSDAAAAGGAAMLQTGIKNVLASFGYTDAELQSSQQLQQAVAEIKAGKMAELGARGLTDKDMEILTQSLPRLDSDPNARKAIASILMRANEATIDEYADAVRWEDEQYPEQKFRRPSWLKNRNKPIIEDGFRYKGPMPPTVTDKANPANWEKL